MGALEACCPHRDRSRDAVSIRLAQSTGTLKFSRNRFIGSCNLRAPSRSAQGHPGWGRATRFDSTRNGLSQTDRVRVQASAHADGIHGGFIAAVGLLNPQRYGLGLASVQMEPRLVTHDLGTFDLNGVRRDDLDL